MAAAKAVIGLAIGWAVGTLASGAAFAGVLASTRTWWRRRAARRTFPDRITLVPTEAPWRSPAVPEGWCRELRILGWVDAGQFTVRELPGIVLAALVLPGEGAVAAVYEHPTGHWVELVAESRDGAILILTTRPTDDWAPSPSWRLAKPQSERSIVELDGELRRLLPDDPMRIDPADATFVLAAAYRRQAAWCRSRGVDPAPHGPVI